MRVYLIRHGETEQNRKKCLQGQTDIPLNQNGIWLAEQTGKALAHIDFDCVFSSPLTRALETAKKMIGSKKIPIIKDERIQEISFGEYEGLCYGKQGYNIPDPDFLNFFRDPERYNTPPKGENFADVIARTGKFWKELVQDRNREKQNILISTHGCALNAILANIRPTKLQEFWGEGVHANCAVTIVEVKDGKTEILKEGKILYQTD